MKRRRKCRTATRALELSSLALIYSCEVAADSAELKGVSRCGNEMGQVERDEPI